MKSIKINVNSSKWSKYWFLLTEDAYLMYFDKIDYCTRKNYYTENSINSKMLTIIDSPVTKKE